jgi:hypothetical protein
LGEYGLIRKARPHVNNRLPRQLARLGLNTKYLTGVLLILQSVRPADYLIVIDPTTSLRQFGKNPFFDAGLSINYQLE